jgi:hypothetical protein
VRILLPPSEAKLPGGRGRPISGRPTPLEQPRQQVLRALSDLLDDPVAAAGALQLPPSVAEAAIRLNRAVTSAPTMPAIRRYTGIVYAGLDPAALSEPARRLANRQLLIFSGLFGVLRATEPVPAYRVPASAVLPGLGQLAGFWRRQLTGPAAEQLADLLGHRGPIIDLRSTDYAAMWQPAPASAAGRRLLAVRVLSRRPAGDYGVISYQSKLAKGRLAAALLERAAAGVPVRGPDDLRAAWTGLGGTAAESRATRTGLALDLYE